MSLISVFEFFTNTLSCPRSDSRHLAPSCTGNEACPSKPHHHLTPGLSNSPRSSPPTTVPPTPAMALQIQMPPTDPILRSSTPAGSPPSRPHSPHPSFRPSSRSERLLRDTLRKADERHFREHSLTRRTSNGRRTTNDRDHAVEDLQELDEGTWLSNGPMTDHILRRQSISLSPSRCASPDEERTSPLSTSPVVPALVRTHTAPAPIHRRGSSSISSVPIPRAMTSKPASPTPSSSFQRNTPLGPHEAVLRSRLENVLSRVSSAPDDFNGGTKSTVLRVKRPYSGHARSQSLAGSPVVQEEWPWTRSHDSSEATAPLTPPPTPPSNVSHLAPATPPSPFNASAASQICRSIPGYVSFQDVEGLGEPPSTEEEEVGDEKGKDDKKWWNWPWTGRARAQSH